MRVRQTTTIKNQTNNSLDLAQQQSWKTKTKFAESINNRQSAITLKKDQKTKKKQFDKSENNKKFQSNTKS